MADLKKSIEFDWTPAFETDLLTLLVKYRIAERPAGSWFSTKAFERQHASDFIQSLKTLMDSQRPELSDDSEIAALMDRVTLAKPGGTVYDGRAGKILLAAVVNAEEG